jgi:hypothetical protein
MANHCHPNAEAGVPLASNQVSSSAAVGAQPKKSLVKMRTMREGSADPSSNSHAATSSIVSLPQPSRGGSGGSSRNPSPYRHSLQVCSAAAAGTCSLAGSCREASAVLWGRAHVEQSSPSRKTALPQQAQGGVLASMQGVCVCFGRVVMACMENGWPPCKGVCVCFGRAAMACMENGLGMV